MLTMRRLQFRLGLGAFEHLPEFLPLYGSEFHGASEGLRLFRRFHIGGDDAGRAAVERHRGGVRIRRRDAHHRRQTERGVGLAHPADLLAIQRGVFGVDEHEIQPAAAHGVGPAWRRRDDERAEDSLSGKQTLAQLDGVHSLILNFPKLICVRWASAVPLSQTA